MSEYDFEFDDGIAGENGVSRVHIRKYGCRVIINVLYRLDGKNGFLILIIGHYILGCGVAPGVVNVIVYALVFYKTAFLRKVRYV